MMVRGMDLASATDMADMADRTTVATTRAFILLIVLCCSVCVEEHGAPFCIGFLWRENEIYQSYERVYSTIPTCHQSQRSVGNTTPFGVFWKQRTKENPPGLHPAILTIFLCIKML